MKASVAIVMGATCLMASPASAAPDSLIGLWRTSMQDGIIEIYRCGAKLCGRVVDAGPLHANPDQRDVRNKDVRLRNRRLRHLVILEGFSGGPDRWSGGPLYDPDTGAGAPRGSLTLAGRRRLNVEGCIAVFLCRSQVWTRLPALHRDEDR